MRENARSLLSPLRNRRRRERLTDMLYKKICASFVGQLTRLLLAKHQLLSDFFQLKEHTSNSAFPVLFYSFYIQLAKRSEIKGVFMNQIFSFILWNLCLSFVVSICFRQSYHHYPIITEPLPPHVFGNLKLTFLLPPSDIFVHHSNLGLWLVNFATFMCKCVYIWWHMQIFSLTSIIRSVFNLMTSPRRVISALRQEDERTFIFIF